MLYWNTEIRPLKFLLPSRKTIIWKKDVGLDWCYPALKNSYCLTPFSPNCLVIITLSFKFSSKVLQTLQRSCLKVWDWQTFSSFFSSNCQNFTFADCMVSPLCAELKKALCCKCVFSIGQLSKGQKASRPNTVSALSSLSCSFTALSLFLSPRIFLSLSIPWPLSLLWFLLRL